MNSHALPMAAYIPSKTDVCIFCMSYADIHRSFQYESHILGTISYGHPAKYKFDYHRALFSATLLFLHTRGGSGPASNTPSMSRVDTLCT
mmetsp:Transcript_7945/g.20733  ORF Transcript_7945/g.20733 Transcript_7945/m.20733 type:complete len:90 (+) Transcript_7945:669-938(+)